MHCLQLHCRVVCRKSIDSMPSHMTYTSTTWLTVQPFDFAEDDCGDVMMWQTFDQYPGPPANYTEDMIAADFPQGDERQSAGGKSLAPGLFYTRGFGRAYVGQDVLRIEMPQGATHHICCEASCTFNALSLSSMGY